MIIYSAHALEMGFGESTLFHDVSFEVQNDDKIGLVGVNGTGKTTLFKLITGDMQPEGGTLSKGAETKIGYMEQHVIRDSSVSVFDEVLTVFGRLIAMEHELEQIHSAIDGGNTDEALINKQLRLTEEFERDGGLTYRARVGSTLGGLGFDENDREKPVSVLSGGEKSKLQLAKLLLSDATLLLLDEPTNHLDIDSVEWLERFLSDYRGAYIVISHDRYFLDKAAGKILELENKHMTLYKGNYSSYTKQKEENRVIAQKHYEQTVEEIHRIEAIIAQQKTFGQERNYITIAHKQKSIDRLQETLEKPEELPDAIHFNFNCNDGSGNDVLFAKNLAKTFDGELIFRGAALDIKRKERVFLLGGNGCGKTTLFKVLTGQYDADFGEFSFGARIQTGYFDQIQTGLTDTKTVIDEVWDAYPRMNQTEVRTSLGAFLFKGDDVFKLVGKLSGGEKARVALLKLMLGGANLLLLDEPTNHLDINSREALEKALTDYPGTLFIISHDRYLINKLADKVYVLDKDGTRLYEGNYDSYLEQREKELARLGVTEAGKPEKNESDNAVSYRKRKEQESERRKAQTRLKRLEERIAELEAEIAQKNQLLSQPEVASDYERTMTLTSEIAADNGELETLMEEWSGLYD